MSTRTNAEDRGVERWTRENARQANTEERQTNAGQLNAEERPTNARRVNARNSIMA